VVSCFVFSRHVNYLAVLDGALEYVGEIYGAFCDRVLAEALAPLLLEEDPDVVRVLAEIVEVLEVKYLIYGPLHILHRGDLDGLGAQRGPPDLHRPGSFAKA
jgi:hypothetical protein